MFALGASNMHFRYENEQNKILPYIGATNTYIGKVISSPTPSGAGLRAYVKIKNFKVLLTVYGDTFNYGDTLTFKTTLTKPRSSANEGEFDYSNYLMSRGVFLTATANSVDIKPYSLKPYIPSDLAQIIRNFINSSLTKYYKGDNGALLRAILIGDRSQLSTRLNEELTNSGISHIVSVSGMHVGAILSIIMLIASLRRKKLLSNILCIFVICLFILVSGSNVSAVRAGIMAVMLLISDSLRRDNDSLTSLGTAFFLILLISPYSLWDTGFQLSVAATLGIILFNKKISRRLDFISFAPVKELAAVSLAAVSLTLPITMHSFYQVIIIGLLMNLLAVPLLPFIMGGGILTVIFAGFAPLAALFSGITDAMLSIIIYSSRIMMYVPFSHIETGSYTDLFIVLYFIVFAYILIRKIEKLKKLVLILPLIFSTIILIFLFINYQNLNDMNVNFLNVGNGSCTIITIRGKSIMLDASGKNGSVKNTVIPFLKREGIAKLNAVIACDPSQKNIDCLTELANNDLVKSFILPVDGDKQLPKIDIPCIFVDNTSTIALGDVKLNIVLSQNGHLSIMANYKGRKILFASYTDYRAERNLSDIKCDIVRLSDNGSRFCSSNSFITFSGANYFIISNRKADDETLQKLKNKNYFITGVNGNIKLTITSKGKLELKTLYD